MTWTTHIRNHHTSRRVLGANETGLYGNIRGDSVWLFAQRCHAAAHRRTVTRRNVRLPLYLPHGTHNRHVPPLRAPHALHCSHSASVLNHYSLAFLPAASTTMEPLLACEGGPGCRSVWDIGVKGGCSERVCQGSRGTPR